MSKMSGATTYWLASNTTTIKTIIDRSMSMAHDRLKSPRIDLQQQERVAAIRRIAKREHHAAVLEDRVEQVRRIAGRGREVGLHVARHHEVRGAARAHLACELLRIPP